MSASLPDWRLAVLAATAPLLVSLLAIWRQHLPGSGSQAWPIAGMVLVAAGLVVGGCLRNRVFAPASAALAMAVALGLVTPALAVAATLLAQASRDPAMIVITPSWFGLGLLVIALVVAWGLLLMVRPPGRLVTPMLLSPGLLVIWLPAMSTLASEAFYWATVSTTFAMLAVMWFAVLLLPAQLAPGVGLAAVAVTWAMALSVSGPVPAPTVPGSTVLTWTIAAVASLTPVIVGLIVSAWSGRARSHQPALPQRV
jgi:hypothetical protein